MTPPTPAPITPWLQHLSQLMPATGVLLVGAGAGTSPWVQLLQTLAVPSATLVEADDTQFAHLQRSVPQRDGWRLRKQVVGPHTETVTYHRASNATESGLLEPESLRSLWPNLKTTHKQTRQAITLAELQQDTEPPANWLLVDCLPALPIIQGAAQQLAAFDVIALRVLLDDNADELQAALQALGFRCLAIEPSRHPAVGHALFVRDTAAQAKAASAQLDAEHAEAIAQRDALAQDKAALTAARDEQAKLAAERQTALIALQTQQKDASTQQQRIQQLEAANQDYAARQHMLQEELIKAEAQLDLIKDLLLREPGL